MIKAYLYDAKGEDRELSLDGDTLPKLDAQKLLWLDVTGREEEDLARLGRLLALEVDTLADLRKADRASALSNYGSYFHCDVAALVEDPIRQKGTPTLPKVLRLDLIVGTEWLATIHADDIPFLDAFREQDRGETLIGGLTSASLGASLLDMHLTAYLASIERLEEFLDTLDVRMLARNRVRDELLKEVLAGRRYVARLRRNLAPQRVVFYGLSRPDFELVASSASAPHFHALERHFDRATDAVKQARDLVQGSFDLFNTRVAESTNLLIRRLTFLSLALGGIGAIAGIFGMNFQTRYTETGETGFWAVVLTLLALVAGAGALSRWKKWI